MSILAVLLACGVVALGAYTRLQDAGLGCPDWPGCYGHLVVPESHDALHRANSAYPERPVEAEKAWAEMIHRYFASTLGLVILILLALSIKARKLNPQAPLKLPIALTVLVIFQGLLGMWTVTLGLFPTVVMAHLLGGFTTLSLLFLLALRLHFPAPITNESSSNGLLKWALVGIVILALQIALGGWTAANYAARVCSELPICQDGWSQHVNVVDAFQFWGHNLEEHGLDDYEFASHLGPDAKITIHASHRIGAIVTTLYLIGLFIWLWRRQDVSSASKRIATGALVVLLAQVSLGVSNVVFDLPLAVAVAHNGVAALLMMCLIMLTFSLYQSGSRRP
ncbi:MAG TPA: COX15/CtaA family protein [Dongiaceae bacterium]|nr:COX15/CtaA family protein [Dongiaceae bacterium]